MKAALLATRLAPLLLLAAAAANPAALATKTPSLSLRFEPTGEASGRYLARGPGYAISVDPSGMRLQLAGSEGASTTVRMSIVGGDPEAPGRELDTLAGKSHYLIGNDETKWRRNVPHFSRVAFHNVYPGVDVIYRGLERYGSAAGPAQLEYDFTVAPGADPGLIELAFEGVDDLQIGPGGGLVLRTAAGDLRQHRPFIYQDIGGKREEVDGHFVLRDDGRVGFSVGDYDSSAPLVIDPKVEFATYLGGGDYEALTRVVFDEATQQLLLAGWTFSPNFPANPETRFANFLGGRDGFVSALSADASTLLWTTFVGTPGVDVINDLEVFEDVLWLTGHTEPTIRASRSPSPTPSSSASTRSC